MELKVQKETEEAEFAIYQTDFHRIKMKLDENDDTSADKFVDRLSKKKISEEEFEKFKRNIQRFRENVPYS